MPRLCASFAVPSHSFLGVDAVLVEAQIASGKMVPGFIGSSVHKLLPVHEMNASSALCMHFESRQFRGTFACTVSDKLELRATALPGTTVCVQTKPKLALPLWLRAYVIAANAWTCKQMDMCTTTCMRHHVLSIAGSMTFSSSLLNFNTWTLELPFCPSIPLERIIGMRAVHVVLFYGDVEMCSTVIQQRRRCSRLRH